MLYISVNATSERIIPTIPFRVIIGTNTTMVVRTEPKIDEATSSDPLTIACLIVYL